MNEDWDKCIEIVWKFHFLCARKKNYVENTKKRECGMKIKFITKMHLYGLWGFIVARGGWLGGWINFWNI